MVLRRTWVSEKFLVRSQNLGSVFDGSPWVSKSRFRVILASRSLEFFLPTVFFIFRLVFRSRIFRSSWVQLINRTELVN